MGRRRRVHARGSGALIAVWRANNRLAVFLSLWSFGLLAAYSLVGYKTPWISLNFVVPLALTSGYTLDVVYQKLREFRQPRLLVVFAVLIVAFCGYQLYQLNFVHYDDDQLPYVYAHTKRQMLAMLDEIDSIAQKNRHGRRNWHRDRLARLLAAALVFSRLQEGGLLPANRAHERTNHHRFDGPGRTTERKPTGIVTIPSIGRTKAADLRPGVDLLLYVGRTWRVIWSCADLSALWY